MANQVTLTFAGDSRALEKANERVLASNSAVTDGVSKSTREFSAAADAVKEQESRMTRLGATTAGVSAAIGDAGGTMQSFIDLQQAGANRAQEHARALSDMKQAGLDAEQATGDLAQAQIDLKQAFVDVKQAARDVAQSHIDVEQAQLDAEKAAKDYADAVKEHGKGSIEARQALIDQKQAQEDLKQAQLDGQQAIVDQKQAQEDANQAGRDAKQANQDAASAMLDLAEAARAANPPDMQRWATDAQALAGVIAGVAGAVNLLALAHSSLSLAALRSAAATAAAKVATVASAVATGVATAAQWLWNAAFAASGIGAVVILVGLLVTAIIYVATKTDWFQRLWKAIWGGIVAYIKWVVNNYKAAFHAIVSAGEWLWSKISSVANRIKKVFTGIGSAISGAFRAAFNFVANAWNNTVGRLQWSVPKWVPSIGGNHIGVPQLPTYHTGGTIPGLPGTEVVIRAMAGERVSSIASGGDGGRTVIELRSGGARLDDLLIEILIRALRTRPDVRAAVGGARA
jgi:hypothetical protein